MSATMPGRSPLLQTETCPRAQLQGHNHLSVAEALPAVACCTVPACCWDASSAAASGSAACCAWLRLDATRAGSP